MRKQDYLIQLIQSLSPNERRYFRLFSDIQSGDKKYMQLYELLEKSMVYDTSVLSKQMSVSAAQLARLKHYLNQELLSCLRNYQEKETEIVRLNKERIDARNMIKRRLYDYALELTEKTLERAWQLEQFEAIPLLLRTKYDCLFNLSRFNEIKSISGEHKRVQRILEENVELDQLNAEAVRMERSREKIDNPQKLLEHPLIKNKPEKLLSLTARTLWYRTVMSCYIIMPSCNKQLLSVARAQKEFYEKNPAAKTAQPIAYLTSFAHLADGETDAGNYAKALEVYAEMENVIDGRTVEVSPTRTTSLKAYLYVSRMIIFSRLGQFEKVLPEEKKLQPLIGRRPVYEQIDAAITLAIAQIHLKRSDLAVDKLNEMMDMDIPERPPQFKTLRALAIMVQVDLGNYSLVPYLIKSAKSWMKRNKYTEPEYDTFFSLIAAVANPSKNSTRRQAWARLNQSIKEGHLQNLNNEVYLDKWAAGRVV